MVVYEIVSGTTFKIKRFDGYAFTNFTTDDGLPDRRVNDFLETRDSLPI